MTAQQGTTNKTSAKPAKRGPLGHASAKRYALIAQCAAALLAGAALVFAFAWAPGTSEPKLVAYQPATPPDPASADQQPAAEEDDFTFDADGFVTRINETKNAPQPPEPEPETPGQTGAQAANSDEPEQTEQPSEQQPGALADVRYLGSLRDPRSARALVSVNGRQRIVAVGAEINGYTLMEVGDDAIRLRSGADFEDIEKAETRRGGSSIASGAAGGSGSDEMFGGRNPDNPLRRPQEQTSRSDFREDRPTAEEFANMTREERQAYREEQMERLRAQRARNAGDRRREDNPR